MTRKPLRHFCDKCQCRGCMCDCHLEVCSQCGHLCNIEGMGNSISLGLPYGSFLDGSFEFCSEKCLSDFVLSRGKNLADVDLPPDNE